MKHNNARWLDDTRWNTTEHNGARRNTRNNFLRTTVVGVFVSWTREQSRNEMMLDHERRFAIFIVESAILGGVKVNLEERKQNL